jgi:hypothetical protein
MLSMAAAAMFGSVLLGEFDRRGAFTWNISIPTDIVFMGDIVTGAPSIGISMIRRSSRSPAAAPMLLLGIKITPQYWTCPVHDADVSYTRAVGCRLY